MSQPPKPISLNWLAVYLVAASLPIQELIDILYAKAPTTPLGFVLGAEIALGVCIFQSPGQWPSAAVSAIRRTTLVWSIFWAVAIAARIMFLPDIRSNIAPFLSSIVPLFTVIALGNILLKISDSYERFYVLLLAVGFSAIDVPPSADLMMKAIDTLPDVYDSALYRFDDILGLGWVASFAHVMDANPVTEAIIRFNYRFLVLYTILASISEYIYKPPYRYFVINSNLLNALFGYMLYFLMPAMGPLYLFGALFPDHLPPAAQVPTHGMTVAVNAYRNGIPSLHASGAMLIFLSLRDSPLWHRAIALLVIVTILISTLGLGEHYAVDWLAALPLVLFLRGLSAVWLPVSLPARRNAILIGAALLGFWVLAVRGCDTILEFPWTLWLLAIASLVLPVLVERRLALADEGTGTSLA